MKEMGQEWSTKNYDGPLKERDTWDGFAALEGCFLTEELSDVMKAGYVDLLERSTVYCYRKTQYGLVLYFRNGHRIQFRQWLLKDVVALLRPHTPDSKKAMNCQKLEVLQQTLGL